MKPFLHPLTASLLVALLLLMASQSTVAGTLTLALANSTCNAIKQAAKQYQSGRKVDITFICKSSGLLAKGLRGRALHADIFLSANRAWMDFAVDHDLVDSRQIHSPMGNALVIAIPQNSPLQLANWQELASDKVSTIIIGDPSTTPNGRHSKEALISTGLWQQVRHKLITRKNITLLANSLAKADNKSIGILFKTNLNEKLREIHAIDPSWHQPVRYYLAPLKQGNQNPETAPFVQFLSGPVAGKILADYQFDINPR
jgi:molybdate transport system substrate-binding protein